MEERLRPKLVAQLRIEPEVWRTTYGVQQVAPDVEAALQLWAPDRLQALTGALFASDCGGRVTGAHLVWPGSVQQGQVWARWYTGLLVHVRYVAGDEVEIVSVDPRATAQRKEEDTGVITESDFRVAFRLVSGVLD